MRILVTGATGFIGSQTVKSLIQWGHQVAALSRNPAPQSLDEAGQITHLQGSLAQAPWDAIKSFAPDTCLHSAWITTPGIYLDSEENDILVSDSLNFLKQMEQLGVNRFVALGTCIEYDLSGGNPLQEKRTKIDPSHRYSKAKAQLHEQLRQTLSPDSTLTWARIFYPYGSGEAPERLSSLLIKKACAGEAMELKQPENTLDYIHISDIASALTTVLEASPGGSINIGTGTGISVLTLAEEICDLMDCSKLIYFPKTDFLNDPVSIIADSSTLRSLGWKPETSLKKGLEDLITKLCPELLNAKTPTS
ncbi:MAG: NAD(P)-dependent oxidoreductase [Verrucomicrobiota bacterium]